MAKPLGASDTQPYSYCSTESSERPAQVCRADCKLERGITESAHSQSVGWVNE